MSTYNLVEGWTDPVDCTLKAADGPASPPVALNLTGLTVALLAYDKNDAPLTLTGTAVIQSASTGQVRFSPAATDLKAENSPLKIRWRITDGGKIRYVPNVEPDTWIVRKP